MTHPLVLQLRFTRSEFRRALRGLKAAEARKRFLPLNSISWNVGHLAWQEQRYFLYYAQGKMLLPEIDKAFAFGAPASTPRLATMISAWDKVAMAADPWLAKVDQEKLLEHVVRNGKRSTYLFGSLLQRMIYHYWYHIGENLAIRQNLGHKNLPQFVGDLDGQAPYRPDVRGAVRRSR
jgi:hypothetical protein